MLSLSKMRIEFFYTIKKTRKMLFILTLMILMGFFLSTAIVKSNIYTFDKTQPSRLTFIASVSDPPSKLWNFSTAYWIYSSPVLGDIDGDGKLEVVFGSYDWRIYALNGENGSQLWNFTTGYAVYAAPSLGDIDGDGKLEVVIGSTDGYVYALNGENGTTLELYYWRLGNFNSCNSRY